MRRRSISPQQRQAWRVRRGPRERALAALATGPAGHLYAVVADIGEIALRLVATKARARSRP